jgi:hypothetical protein
MAKTLKHEITGLVFAVTFSGENEQPVLKIKSTHVGTKKYIYKFRIYCCK